MGKVWQYLGDGTIKRLVRPDDVPVVVIPEVKEQPIKAKKPKKHKEVK